MQIGRRAPPRRGRGRILRDEPKTRVERRCGGAPTHARAAAHCGVHTPLSPAPRGALALSTRISTGGRGAGGGRAFFAFVRSRFAGGPPRENGARRGVAGSCHRTPYTRFLNLIDPSTLYLPLVHRTRIPGYGRPCAGIRLYAVNGCGCRGAYAALDRRTQIRTAVCAPRSIGPNRTRSAPPAPATSPHIHRDRHTVRIRDTRLCRNEPGYRVPRQICRAQYRSGARGAHDPN